jgi:hypothetical protein
MRRRVTRRDRGLIRNPKNKKVVIEEERNFRVIASSKDQNDFWTVGYYTDFKKAKEEIDNLNTSDVIYYIYSNDNRVLYNTTGELDGQL